MLISNNNKNHLTRLQDRLRTLDSRPNLIDLNRTNRTGLKLNLSPLLPVKGRTILRGVVTKSSSPTLNIPRLPQSSETQPFPLPILPRPDIPVGGRLAHFMEKWGELTQNKWVLSIVRDGVRIPFNSTPPLSTVPIGLNHSSFLLYEQRYWNLQKRAVERVQDPGTPGFYSRLFLVPKKNVKLRPVIDLSLLNQYIRKRASAQKVYDANWVVYSNWCHRRKVNPVSAPLTVIADFLIYLFSEKKKVK